MEEEFLKSKQKERTLDLIELEQSQQKSLDDLKEKI